MFTFPFVTDPWSALPEVMSCCNDKTEKVTANVSNTGRRNLTEAKTRAQS